MYFAAKVCKWYFDEDRLVNIAGLFMALQPRIIACGTKRATVGMVIRFLCGPIIMSAASLAVGLRGEQLHAAIVQVLYIYHRSSAQLINVHPYLSSTFLFSFICLI
jgi:hypothetical protein